jgi:hypothetical protein
LVVKFGAAHRELFEDAERRISALRIAREVGDLRARDSVADLSAPATAVRAASVGVRRLELAPGDSCADTAATHIL